MFWSCPKPQIQDLRSMVRASQLQSRSAQENELQEKLISIQVELGS